MVHKTDTMNYVQQLRARAKELDAAIKAASILSREVGITDIMKSLQDQRDRALAKAAALVDSGQNRLEDLQVYQVERVTESKKSKSTKSHYYWYASWRHGSQVHNEYLGSMMKLDYSAAYELARKRKAEDLGLNNPSSENDL